MGKSVHDGAGVSASGGSDADGMLKRRSMLKLGLAAGASSLLGGLVAGPAGAAPWIADAILTGVAIASGFHDTSGSAYQASTGRLLMADSGAGSLRSLVVQTHAVSTIGTGYTGPSDIVLSADGVHAYVADAPGTLLKISLASANRASATVIASGFNGIDQIALDEARGCIYVAEFTGGTIRKVNLATLAVTTVAAVANPRGLLLTSDGRFLYVCGDTDQILKLDLQTNTRTVVVSGLGAPRHMAWADASESVIVVPVPNPTPQVLKVDLTASPIAAVEVAAAGVSNPYSVAFPSPNRLLIVGSSQVAEVDFTSSVFTSAGPLLLGIGFVPADSAHIFNGYADTTVDPSYFYQVKDCPFGGTLPLQINHDKAYALGYRYYRVMAGPMGGAQQVIQQTFTDLKWNPSTLVFEEVTRVPTTFSVFPTVTAAGLLPVRLPTDIWLNHWLGLLFDTSGLQNGLNTITVQYFTSLSSGVGAQASVNLMIDNTAPTAEIGEIMHDGSPVCACAIISSGSHTFTFQVTASAPKHLRGWELVAYWGNNKSAVISQDDYSHHITPSRIWTGLTNVFVPPPGPGSNPWEAEVQGDPTSIHCAHTFSLAAWDRVINGWNYIHGAAGYNKSLTLLFGPNVPC